MVKRLKVCLDFGFGSLESALDYVRAEMRSIHSSIRRDMLVFDIAERNIGRQLWEIDAAGTLVKEG